MFSPDGKQGQLGTLSLVIGPEKEKTIGTAPIFRGNQNGLRPELYSSFQRLNPLRALLYLPPVASSLKGFGEFFDALKGFVQSDYVRGGNPCAATWEALGALCPDASEADRISTFEVMQKLFPDHMRSLFELQFTIHIKCLCKSLPPAKHVSMSSMCIAWSSCPGIKPEQHIFNHVRSMRDICCIGCKHTFEVQKAPPILAVYWIPSSSKSELIHPALHLSMKSVFDSGLDDDLDYQLVSFCSKAKADKSLWSAHCKLFQDENWRTIKDTDLISIYGWDSTCKLSTRYTHRLLFYVKTSALPVGEGDPRSLDVGCWVMALYRDKKVHYPAQIVEIIPTQNRNEPLYKLSWDDGDEDDRIKPAHQIQPLLDVAGKPSSYPIGDNVLAKCGITTKDSPACIERCFTNNSCLVSWEDGTTTNRVIPVSKIRKMGTPERTRRAADRYRQHAGDVGSPTRQKPSSELNTSSKQGLKASISMPDEESTARNGMDIDQQGPTFTRIQSSIDSDNDHMDQTADLGQERKEPNKNERQGGSNIRRSTRRNNEPLRESSQPAPAEEGANFGVRASDCFIFNIFSTFFRMPCLAH